MDLSRSNGRDVWMHINRRSSGLYKCQVLVEGTFTSVSAEKRMEVLVEGQRVGSAANGGANAPVAAVSPDTWLNAGPNARPKLQVQNSAAAGGPNMRANSQAHQAVQQQASSMYGFHSTGHNSGQAPRPEAIDIRCLQIIALLISLSWALLLGSTSRQFAGGRRGNDVTNKTYHKWWPNWRSLANTSRRGKGNEESGSCIGTPGRSGSLKH